MNLLSKNDRILGSKKRIVNRRAPIRRIWTIIDHNGVNPKKVFPENRILDTIRSKKRPRKSSKTAKLSNVCPSFVFNLFILLSVLTVVPILVGTNIKAKNADALSILIPSAGGVDNGDENNR